MTIDTHTQPRAEVQRFDELRAMPLALPEDARRETAALLNQVLSDVAVGDARHVAAQRAAELRDDGSNDLLVSDVLRTNEQQAWFVAEHLVEAS